MENRKTIFITSFHSVISRNILLTGTLDELSKTMKVVLLVPKIKEAYFKEEFSSPNVFIEGVDTKLRRRDIFFRKAILAFTYTRGLYIKKRAELFIDKKYISFLFSILPAFLFRNAKIPTSIIHFFDRATYRHDRFEEHFTTYNPSIVFSTDIQNELDVCLIQEAGKRGISNIGMIRSWDNLSSKGLLRVLPQTIIVHNELIKEKLIRINHMPPERIRVVGIPHYDRYLKGGTKIKEAFFEEYGLDLTKKVILFSPIGNRYIRDNKLDELILDTLSNIDANIFVRLPPADTVNLDEKKERYANVVFDHTGVRPWQSKENMHGSKISEIGRVDDEKLINTLAFSDVVVTGQSTIVIDASVFDKPVVSVSFDQENRSYYDSMKRYYDYDYYRPIVESGGVRFAKNPKELESLVRAYLENPGRDRDGRERIRKEQMQFVDGKSTDRLVDAIVSISKGT